MPGPIKLNKCLIDIKINPITPNAHAKINDIFLFILFAIGFEIKLATKEIKKKKRKLLIEAT